MTKSTEEIWAEYVYSLQCIEDEAFERVALEELVRRGHPTALANLSVILRYNGDPSDDARGTALLERAASLGDEGARLELESLRRGEGGGD